MTKMFRSVQRHIVRRFHQIQEEGLPNRVKYALVGYAGLVNVIGFGLFAYDKMQAVSPLYPQLAH